MAITQLTTLGQHMVIMVLSYSLKSLLPCAVPMLLNLHKWSIHLLDIWPRQYHVITDGSFCCVWRPCSVVCSCIRLHHLSKRQILYVRNVNCRFSALHGKERQWLELRVSSDTKCSIINQWKEKCSLHSGRDLYRRWSPDGPSLGQAPAHCVRS